jgi:hypothetical protein
LGPEDVRSLHLGAIWNLVKEQCSHDLEIRLCGTTSLFKRLTWIITERDGTRLLFYSIKKGMPEMESM